MKKTEEYEIIDGKKYKKCKENQIRNPITKRCILKKSIKIDSNKEKEEYEIIDGKKYKKCKENQIRNPITKRCILKKDIKKEDDICGNIKVIPQFIGNCWFNSILMASLYSQLSRKVVLRASLKWDKKNNFLMVLKNILFNHYLNTEKTNKYFIKNKTGMILFKMLKTYDDDDKLKEMFKENIKKSSYFSLGYINTHIKQFYKYLGVKCIDLTYIKDNNLCLIDVDKYLLKKQYLKKTDKEIEQQHEEIKQQIISIPDIIILNHSELYNYYTNIIKNIYDNIMMLNNYYKINNLNSYNIKIGNDIKSYKDIITFNGHKYKLDSCLISNYDIGNKLGNHSIVGVTCKNKRYVYNGFEDLYNEDNIKCSLMPFEWNLRKNTEFCLNPYKCNLQLLNPEEKKDLCFSFNKGFRTLVYVRITKDKSEISQKSSIKTVDISNVSSIIEEMYEIEKKTKEEIIEILNKHFNVEKKDIENLSLENIRSFYKSILRKII